MVTESKPEINPAPNGPYIVKGLVSFSSQKGEHDHDHDHASATRSHEHVHTRSASITQS